MSTITKTYLTGYNALNALLWSLVLTRTLTTFLSTSFDPSAIYPSVGEFTRWTQTIIVLDFVHVLFGGGSVYSYLGLHMHIHTFIVKHN